MPDYEKNPKEMDSLLKQSLIKSNAFIEKESLQEFINVKGRMDGTIIFSLKDHIRGMVYSLLSNQRIWKSISVHLDEIDEIFNHYEIEFLKKVNPEVLVDKLKAIKCGNRAIKSQMENLKHNIQILEVIYNEIETEIDYSENLEIVQKRIEEYVEKLSKSSSKTKLIQMGRPLVNEYLKNIGISVMKPDTHILRICGTERLGILNSVKNEKKAKDSQLKKAQYEFLNFSLEIDPDPAYAIYLDNLFWRLGAKGYAEICTTTPKCDFCDLKKFCKYNRR